MVARPSGRKKAYPSPAEAKAKVIELIREGAKVEEACAVVERSAETYRDWRKNDPEFKRQIDIIRNTQADIRDNGRPEVPDFPDFCRDWLKEPLYPHQMRGWQTILGQEPELHESMDYTRGLPNRVLLNFPPDHAKSTTYCVNMVVWLIHKNPSINIVIMSQSAAMAERFLGEIKFKLTSPVYAEMHARFGPDKGWKDSERSWTNTAIFVQGKDGRKDPTVQALGLSGQIYGARADVVILDDIITTKNSREIDKQKVLLGRDIQSRLPGVENTEEKRLPDIFPSTSLLLVLGTRVAPVDLYRELMDTTNFNQEKVWTYLRQPAVLDYHDGFPENWETLWPERWSGPSLATVREGEATWALVYQQLNVTDDMTFKAEAVEASINGARFPGPMTENGRMHRDGGMRGLYVCAGLDPADSGSTAMIVIGYDPETQKRYVLDGFNKANCTPAEMRAKIKHLTDLYEIQEWIIERNAFQGFLARDEDINSFLRARGCRLTPHYTTAVNKFDADFGVAAMAPLFESCGRPDPKALSGKWIRTMDDALIELPSVVQNDWCAKLVQQLVTWMPSGMAQKQKTDLVMALWFAELSVKAFNRRHRIKKTHMTSPFMSQGARAQQKVINLAELRRQKNEALAAGA